MVGFSLGSSGHKVGTHLRQDTLPLKGALRPTLTQMRTSRYASSPHMHIFGMWEETRAPGENPETWGEHVTSTQKVALWEDNIFLFNVIAK